ncbi:uncharacterized protein DDB_G0285291, partial [Cyclospora cayetanensis]|uniref:Uncharacterized protein DDB_G0285291 n=1 Tax=Cyclospora cayetanensis TaxID=88456 RepID=A0A6P6S164_9EIME
MQLPVHPVPQALEAPRAPFGFEFLLQQLPPSIAGYFTSLRQQHGKLQPEQQLLLLAAARDFVLHNMSALRAYGSVQPRLQQQLQQRYKDLLGCIAEEQGQILLSRQRQGEQEMKEKQEKQQQQGEKQEEKLRAQQQHQQQEGGGEERLLGEHGIAALVSLQQLRDALQIEEHSLDAATARNVLQRFQQCQKQQPSRQPEPVRVKPPAALLALDEVYGYIYSPQVLKKQ